MYRDVKEATSGKKLGPIPTRHEEICKRRLFCIHYAECLGIAVKKRWQDFSCERCESFVIGEAEQISGQDQEAIASREISGWLENQ